MKNKKRGSAMILAIAIISMLIILAVSVMTMTTSNRMLTQQYNNTTDLKTLVQTGADYGIAILKYNITQKISSTNTAGGVNNPTPISLQNSLTYNKIDTTSFNLNTIISDLSLYDNSQNTISDATYPSNLSKNYSVSLNVIDGNATTNNNVRVGDCYIEYFDNTPIKDLNDDISNKNCIKMTVTAVGRSVSGSKIYKRVDVYIDKNSISNYFLNKILNNSISIMNSENSASNSGNNDFDMDNDSSKTYSVSVDGNIFFRGNNLNITPPSTFKLNGNLVARLGTNIINLGGITANEKTLQYFNMIPMPSAADLAQLNSTLNMYNLLYDGDATTPFMLTYKVAETGGIPVDFNQIVFGDGPDQNVDNTGNPDINPDGSENNPLGYESDKNGIRYFIKSNSTAFGYVNDVDLAKLFKMVIVYGDLNINAKTLYYDGLLNDDTDTSADSPKTTPQYFRPMVATNYIIICFGKVTISGKLKLENSSIYANQIKFLNQNTDDTNYTDYDPNNVVRNKMTTSTAIEINGIARPASSDSLSSQFVNYYYSWPQNVWGYFNSNKLQIINEYLNQNLPIQYKQGLEFNVVGWQEY